MPKHSNAASISIETRSWPMGGGCKHFCCCHGNMDSVHMPSIGSEFLPSACMHVRQVVGGLANINTSSILWRSQCGAVGGEGMLQQSCKGCGREHIRQRCAGLGEVISGFIFNNCSCLGSCCTLELGDKATHNRLRQWKSGSRRKKKTFKMSLSLLRDRFLFFHIFFNFLSESQKKHLNNDKVLRAKGKKKKKKTDEVDFSSPMATEKVWNHPTFNIHVAFFQIGKSCLSH